MRSCPTPTERFDRGLKFARYRRLESLQEYVLISQTAPVVEVFQRQKDASWQLREYRGPASAAQLNTLGVSIPLSSLYQDVEVSDAEAE